MTLRRVLPVVCMAVGLTGCSRSTKPAPAGPIALENCLRALTNVATFAEQPFGKAGMVSTYDRSGGNQDWSEWTKAGDDGLVDIATLEGPGCVHRIWCTHVPAKSWCFFFDGETTPRLEVNDGDLFGGNAPFAPPLCGYVSGGKYCYLPFPYARSLRIAVRPTALTPGTRTYYHVNYETYPRGTQVESFPVAMNDGQRALAASAAAAWRDNNEALRLARASCGETDAHEIPPGGATAWLDAEGPGVLAAFAIRLPPDDRRTILGRARALRELVLRIFWDGQSAPSVEVPLGDFFCNAYHARRYSAWPMGRVDDGFVCRFPMPFAKRVRAELRNDGAQPIRVETRYRVTADHAARTAGYFHACWNGSVAGGAALPVLRTHGCGQFVGCFLTAIGTDGSWTILEGDEAFRVDGEEQPSLHGTGLEDYFNGAWYYTGLFDLPLHGLVEKAPIRTDQYRFHLADRVRFDDRLEATFEFGDGNRARGYMSAAAYWYQDKPVPVPWSVAPPASRFPPPDPLEPYAIMAHVFELEREALYREAGERCVEYAEKFPRSPYASVLKLRAAAYTELVNGFAAVKPFYTALAQGADDSPLARQARDLLWFNERPEHALLGLHISGKCQVFLDGKPVGEGGDAARLDVRRLTVSPGAHELTAELLAEKPGSFLSLCLRTHTTNITSACDWEYVEARPAGWPAIATAATNAPPTAWTPFTASRAMFPTMNVWRFEPNAYAGLQSGRQVLLVWPGWSRTPKFKHIFLRTTIHVPAAGEVKPATSGGGHTPSAKAAGEDWQADQSRSID